MYVADYQIYVNINIYVFIAKCPLIYRISIVLSIQIFNRFGKEKSIDFLTFNQYLQKK